MDDEIDEATPRPRSRVYYHATMALGAAALACLVMWLSTARLVLAKLGEMLADVTVVGAMLPPGLSAIVIIMLLASRARRHTPG